jgi:DNA repair exonuclease SbcCD ATPase subunit
MMMSEPSHHQDKDIISDSLSQLPVMASKIRSLEEKLAHVDYSMEWLCRDCPLDGGIELEAHARKLQLDHDISQSRLAAFRSTYGTTRSTLAAHQLQLETIQKNGINEDEFKSHHLWKVLNDQLKKRGILEGIINNQGESCEGSDDDEDRTRIGLIEKAINSIHVWNKHLITVEADRMKQKRCAELNEQVWKAYLAQQCFASLVDTMGQCQISILQLVDTLLVNTLDTITGLANEIIRSVFPVEQVVVLVVTIGSKNTIEVTVLINGVERDINSMSGGERERVELAFMLALAHTFGIRILMLDEPLGSLDIDSQRHCIRAIQRHRPNDCLVIITGHGMDTTNVDHTITL